MAQTPKIETPSAHIWAALALVASTLLLYEVMLTRVSSLRYHFHFSYLVVSNCLLGFGLSGTALFIYRDVWWNSPSKWLGRVAGAYALSLVAAWCFMHGLPVHRGSMELWGILSFTLFNGVTALPFFFGGCYVGLVLSRWGRLASRLYAVDLIFAGIGCALCPVLLSTVGGEGVLAVAVAGATAAWGLGQASVRCRRLLGLVAFGVAASACLLGGHLRLPSKRSAPILSSHWSATSRVDVLHLEPTERKVVSLGTKHQGATIPPQVELVQDGTASTYLTDFSGSPEALKLLTGSLYGAASAISLEPSVLVVGFGGGHDVWAALHGGARRVVGVDMNPRMLTAHTELFRDYSYSMLEDPRVVLRVNEGRSALMRVQEQFDLVQMSGIDTWAALTSGAYMLAENHLYTQEGFQHLLDRVAPGGMLQIVRMGAEMEVVRVLALVREVSGELGRFAESVVVLGGSHHLVGVIVRPGGFELEQKSALLGYAEEHGFDVLYHPDEEHPGWIQSFVRSPDPQGFIEAFPKDVRPPTDDRPYFFSFDRWDRFFASATTIREPTYVSQGNPVFLVLQLAGHSVLAFLLLLLPLRRVGVSLGGQGTRVGIYFGGVGLGFILAEMGLLQKMQLLLGHPGLSLPVTLGGLLVFSGVGAWSLGGRRLPFKWRLVASVVFGAVILASAATIPWVVSQTLSWGIGARVMTALALLLPVGLLLGVPMALGVRNLDATRPGMIPWAWAVNGFFTVIGSILSVVVSMNAGFQAVMFLAAVCYGVAFLAFVDEDRA